MKACQPTEEYAPRHAAVLEVLRERASAAAKAEDLKRKKVQRANLSSSEHQSSLNTKVFLKPTREQVDEQWARALIKKGLAIDLVDDKEFRAAVLATARAGLSYSRHLRKKRRSSGKSYQRSPIASTVHTSIV